MQYIDKLHSKNTNNLRRKQQQQQQSDISTAKKVKLFKLIMNQNVIKTNRFMWIWRSSKFLRKQCNLFFSLFFHFSSYYIWLCEKFASNEKKKLRKSVCTYRGCTSDMHVFLFKYGNIIKEEQRRRKNQHKIKMLNTTVCETSEKCIQSERKKAAKIHANTNTPTPPNWNTHSTITKH